MVAENRGRTSRSLPLLILSLSKDATRPLRPLAHTGEDRRGTMLRHYPLIQSYGSGWERVSHCLGTCEDALDEREATARAS